MFCWVESTFKKQVGSVSETTHLWAEGEASLSLAILSGTKEVVTWRVSVCLLLRRPQMLRFHCSKDWW
jgi:hypothetical protein